MKIIYLIITIIVLIYSFNLFKYRNVYVSYNENGNKIIKVNCNSDFECKQFIGNECEDLGFIIFYKDNNTQIAECGKDLDLKNFLKKKFIKITSFVL